MIATLATQQNPQKKPCPKQPALTFPSYNFTFGVAWPQDHAVPYDRGVHTFFLTAYASLPYT